MVLQRRSRGKECCPLLRDSPKSMFSSRQKHLAVFLFRVGDMPKMSLFLGLTTQRSSITELHLIIPGSNGVTRAETCRGQAWPPPPQPLQKPAFSQTTSGMQCCLMGEEPSHRTWRTIKPEAKPGQPAVKWLLSSKGGRLAPFLAFLFLPTMHALAATSHLFLCTINMLDKTFPESP